MAIIDTTTPVEAVPGISAAKDRHRTETGFFDPSDAYDNLVDVPRTEFLDWVVLFLAAPLYFAFVFLPAFLYRLSVKATSLIYSPLIYVVHSSYLRDPYEMLRDVHELALHRRMRIYSGFVLLMFASKLYLYVSWYQLSDRWQSIPSIEMINAFVVPDAVAPWHLAAVINALLTWFLFFYADYIVTRHRRSPEKAVDRLWVGNFFGTIWFVRGILSVYTISCVLYISASLLPTVHWPPLGPSLFPWSG